MAVSDLFDGHNDAVQFMDTYKSGGRDFMSRTGKGHLDLVRAREGHMVGGLFALSAYPKEEPKDDLTITADGYSVRYAEALDYDYALEQISLQLNALRQLSSRSLGQIRIAKSVSEIERNRSVGVFTIVLHMEGAEAIGPDLDFLDELYEKGLRSLGIVWSRPNIFGYGVPFAYPKSPDTGPGLTPVGKDLVRKCNDLGIMIDVSHLNERGFWDVASISKAPLVATHACAHAVCASTRNLTDRQLDAIRDTDGVIGFNLSVNDVRPDGNLDANTPLEMVVRHIAYLIEKVGADRVALGSDFDGAVMPGDIKDASGLPRLTHALSEHFDNETVERFAFRNWLRVFELSWKQTATLKL